MTTKNKQQVRVVGIRELRKRLLSANDSTLVTRIYGQPPELLSVSGVEAEVARMIALRQGAGIAKYGTTVAANPLSLYEWLEHALEETLDKAIYLRAAMLTLKQQDEDRIRDTENTQASSNTPRVRRSTSIRTRRGTQETKLSPDNARAAFARRIHGDHPVPARLQPKSTTCAAYCTSHSPTAGSFLHSRQPRDRFCPDSI